MNIQSKPSVKKSKRPLTPYNLFYRFKRAKILQACSKGALDRGSTRELIAAPPGLEDLTPLQLRALRPNDAYSISRGVIREELQGNLLPFEGKRSHRKTHGAMSFLEMGQMMCDQWKLVDSSIKAIFEELANEGKQMHREQTSIAKQVQVMSYVFNKSTDSKNDGVIEARLDSAVTSRPPPLPSLSNIIPPSPSPANYCNDEPLPSVDGNYTSNWPTYSPSSPKQDINIVSPISSPRIYSHHRHDFQDIVDSDSIISYNQDPEDQDDFCDFIDKNVHLVDSDAKDPFGLDDDIFTATSLQDVIDVDAMIQHCPLPF
jgi:hypothetical protein